MGKKPEKPTGKKLSHKKPKGKFFCYFFKKTCRKCPRVKFAFLFALGLKTAYMNELTPEQLDQYIKKNLKVEKRIILSITIEGKEYTEPVLVEQLFKVYERIAKGEQIFTTKFPKNSLESLKQRILKDKGNYEI